MANSLRNYTGDGTTTDFLFDVPYIQEADVSATVDDTATSVTFVDPTHVRILPAPLNGDAVVILRTTNNTVATFTFPDLTYLKSENLDGDFLQQLYLHQEVEDLFEIHGLGNNVLIDGSRKMTGDLVVGNGVSGSGIEIRGTASEDSALRLSNVDEEWTGKLQGFDDVSASLNLFAYPNGATTENSYDTQLSLKDGNARINGALGASTTPTLGDHLTNMTWVKAWVAANSYTQTYVDANLELDLGNPATNGLALVSQTDGTRSWAALLGGGDFLADGTVDMTGDLTLRATFPTVTISSDTAGVGSLEFQNASFFKTGVIASNDSEMTVNRYTSTGSLLTTLKLTTDGNVNVNGAVPTADDQLTRRDYVDTLHANRNVIINGNFDVWQRGASFVAAATATYVADRFKYAKNGTMVQDITRSTTVPSYAQSGVRSNYSLMVDCTTADTTIDAGDFNFLTYAIEGYDYARIAGGDATLSFWVMGAKTGIHCVSFRNSGADRNYVKEYTIATANTWQKVELTIPFTDTGGTWDYTNGIGLRVGFILAVGSNFQTTKDTWQPGSYLGTANQVNECDSTANNFHIAQVQFERGSTATPLEYKSIADELLACERYFQKSYQLNDAPGTIVDRGTIWEPSTRNTANLSHGTTFRTTMRETIPSIIIYSPLTGTAGKLDNSGDKAASGQQGNSTGIGYILITSGVLTTNAYWHYTADAEL